MAQCLSVGSVPSLISHSSLAGVGSSEAPSHHTRKGKHADQAKKGKMAAPQKSSRALATKGPGYEDNCRAAFCGPRRQYFSLGPHISYVTPRNSISACEPSFLNKFNFSKGFHFISVKMIYFIYFVFINEFKESKYLNGV
jgi:hypothetical protein